MSGLRSMFLKCNVNISMLEEFPVSLLNVRPNWDLGYTVFLHLDKITMFDTRLMSLVIYQHGDLEGRKAYPIILKTPG